MSETFALRRPIIPELARQLGRAAALGGSRISGVVAQMSVQIVVGALAGPAGIGALQLHMSWTAVCAELVGAGEPTRAMRDTSVWSRSGHRANIHNNLRRVLKLILRNSLLLGAGLVLLAASGAVPDQIGTNNTLLLSIVAAAPLFALARVWAETLKALDQPLLAVTLENLTSPVTLLACCGLMVATGTNVSSALILGAAASGTAVCAISLATRVRTALSAPHAGADTITKDAPRSETGEQIHFWMNGLLNIAFLQLPFLIMPFLVGAEDVGRYAVAHKLVNIITTLLILLAALYAPRFARAAARGETGLCRKLLAQTQWLSVGLFAPLWLLMLATADPLASVFSLPAGSLPALLLILGLGQFANAATGLSGVLLNMSGAAHLEMRLLLLSLTGTALLAVPLAQSHGAIGVAAAASMGIALRNLAAYALARFHLADLENTHHEKS